MQKRRDTRGEHKRRRPSFGEAQARQEQPRDGARACPESAHHQKRLHAPDYDSLLFLGSWPPCAPIIKKDQKKEKREPAAAADGLSRAAHGVVLPRAMRVRSHRRPDAGRCKCSGRATGLERACAPRIPFRSVCTCTAGGRRQATDDHRKQKQEARARAGSLYWRLRESARHRELLSPSSFAASHRLPHLRGGRPAGAGEPGQGHATPQQPPGGAQQHKTEAYNPGGGMAACLAAALAMKDKGNSAFVQGDVGAAIGLYTSAYQTLAAVEPGTDEQMYERSILQMACLINKAQAASTLGEYQEAFSCCSLALEIDPRNVRAYHRRAVALQGLKELEAARHDLEACLYLDPSHKEAGQMLQALDEQIRAAAEMEDEEDVVDGDGGEGRGRKARRRKKKESRLAGLKNEGATCYLNAVIQTLHHLPDLRAAIYSVPTSDVASGAEEPSVRSLFLCHPFRGGRQHVHIQWIYRIYLHTQMPLAIEPRFFKVQIDVS